MAASTLAGRYRLQETLSSTRMAEVWLAVDAELERRVVVKLLAPDADRERFEREARAVAGLSHPNIVQLFDFGEEERWYMVFEYLPGGSLEQRLAEIDVLPGGEVARIARDVAAGLAYAHDRGVVHRDLKPANVLFDSEGRSKIADFGIARVQGIDTLTDPGTVLGTAAYISPEQVHGVSATPATDVYSFGVILYRLLAGRLPFETDSPMQLAALHRDAEPHQLPTNGGDERSRTLAAVAMSALSKEPSRRPANGTALMRALEDRTIPAAATTQVIGAPRPPTSNTRRRVPLIAGLVAAVVLATCGAVAAMLLTDTPRSAPAVTGPPTHAGTTRSPSTAQTATAPHVHPSTNRKQTQTTPTITARPTTAPRTTGPAPPTTAATTIPPATTPATTVTTAPATTAATTPATTPAP